TVQAVPALERKPFPWQHTRLAAARSALTWLAANWQADGSMGVSDAFAATAQAVLAGVALGASQPELLGLSGAPSALDYLASHWDVAEGSAALSGMLLAALVAADQNVHDFTGPNVLARLVDMNDGSGHYGVSAADQAWAMIGLAAARYALDPATVAALCEMQAADGHWSGSAPANDHTYTTALALQALAAAGVDPASAVVRTGLAYLKARQNVNAGFAANASATSTDARATAAAIQAILATDGDPRAQQWLVDGRSPIDELAARQTAGGGFSAQSGAGADALTTAQAIPALLLEVNPLCTRQGAYAVALPIVGGAQ
ncbi:MAG: hypothetical protein GX557_04755, partial [Chloroflexi bacterium]|nr:hypothetical protein [Chloroflexota bacterium]